MPWTSLRPTHVLLVATLLGTALSGTHGPTPDSALHADSVPFHGLGVLAGATPFAFGIDAQGATQLASRGVAVRYGVVWVGPWDLEKGWTGTEEAVRSLVSKNVTPAIQLYYWGDDLTDPCFEQACQTTAGVKDQAGWDELAVQLSERLSQWAPNRTVMVVLESEFNKIGADEAPALDAALAAKADYLHAHVPHALVVLGFGNFGGRLWDQFPAATKAADAIGLQAMRASSRDAPDGYADVANDTLRAALWMQRAFQKPIVLHDVALSSYPEPAGLDEQAGAMRALRQQQGALAAAGVEALLYRSFEDTPNMPSYNYFGDAEASWGLAWAGNATLKPAGQVWMDWARTPVP